MKKILFRHHDVSEFKTLKTNTMKTDAKICTFMLNNIVFRQEMH